jgi:hypothetical protein
MPNAKTNSAVINKMDIDFYVDFAGNSCNAPDFFAAIQ